MAKDRKPDDARPTASRSGSGAGRTGSGGRGNTTTLSKGSGGKGPAGKGGRRPTTQVVARSRRPWGLIAGTLVVVVFAAAVVTYAVVQVNKSNASKVTSADQIKGLQTFDYAAGQQHVQTPVDYQQSPPVGGPHDPYWADCTGTVYTVDIRHENAVHGLEHGAVWITYDPQRISGDQVATLAKLVDGHAGRMLSPYAGLDQPISIQSWNHQLKVQKADDPRLKQFADYFTFNAQYYPEVGASCENPQFKADPLVAGQQSSAVGSTDMPTSPSSAPAP